MHTTCRTDRNARTGPADDRGRRQVAPETTIITLVPTCKSCVVPSAIGPTSKSTSQTKVYSLRIVQEDDDIPRGAPAVRRVTTGNHQNGSLDPFSLHYPESTQVWRLPPQLDLDPPSQSWLSSCLLRKEWRSATTCLRSSKLVLISSPIIVEELCFT